MVYLVFVAITLYTMVVRFSYYHRVTTECFIFFIHPTSSGMDKKNTALRGENGYEMICPSLNNASLFARKG
jgi:hypothetical protein